MEEIRIVGHIYDIQGYSVHDGPGIRTTVYVKGCPLHCAWCHSPESQSFTDELSYVKLRCVGTEKCGLCLTVCKNGALSEGEAEKSPEALAAEESGAPPEMVTKIRVDRGKCDNCLACTAACPADALMSDGYDITVEEAFQKVMKDEIFFKDEGGITISGGEPMSQFDFTYSLAKKCRDAGITVCIDTTGYCAGELLDQMIPVTNLFLYDLKEMDPAKSKSFTGIDNQIVLDNAKRIAQHGGKLQIRIPTIPKLNGGLDNIKKTAEFCKELGDAVSLVQLLPYHRMGVPKYERLDRPYPLKNVDPPTDDYMEERLKIFQDMGIPAQLN